MMADEVPALLEELQNFRVELRNWERPIDELQRSKDAKIVRGFFDTYSHSVLRMCLAWPVPQCI